MTSVAIVLDPAYGEKLRVLLDEHRLWVVHSEVNRQVVESLWRELNPDSSRAMDVTIEEPGRALLQFAEWFDEVVEEVLIHFDDLELIEVVGAASDQSEAIDERMTMAGLVRDVLVPYKLRYFT